MTRGAILLALLLSGCVAARAAEVPGGRFSALVARDLPTFGQRLEIDRGRGDESAERYLAEAWWRLVRCVPVGPTPAAVTRDPLRRAVYASLRYEEARHARLLREGAVDATWLSMLHQPRAFLREPAEPTTAEVRWLPTTERWIDELPVKRTVESRCGTWADELGTRDAGELVAEERATAVALAEAVGALTDPPPVLARVGWLARRQGAVLAYREYRAGRIERAELLASLADALAEPPPAAPLAADDGTAPPRPELALAAELRLIASQVREDPGEAWRTLEPALRLPLAPELGIPLRYHAFVLARRAYARADAIALAGELPPRDHPLYDPHAYEAVQLWIELEDDASMLYTATVALRDRAADTGRDRAVVDDGAEYRAATLESVLWTLAPQSFESRIIELLEDLGPRYQLRERVARLAELALEAEQPDMLRGTSAWLLRRDPGARRALGYRVYLALAAFLDDDPAAFDATIAEMRGPDESARRAQRTQEALTRILGEVLPRLAEWPSSAAARREAWLRRLVGHVQPFLRDERAGQAARPPLLELYRSASAMLEHSPRAYPERVGRHDPSPLMLGRIRVPPEPVPPRDLAWEPAIVHAMAVLPRDASPASWTLAWERTDRPEEGRQ